MGESRVNEPCQTPSFLSKRCHWDRLISNRGGRIRCSICEKVELNYAARSALPPGIARLGGSNPENQASQQGLQLFNRDDTCKSLTLEDKEGGAVQAQMKGQVNVLLNDVRGLSAIAIKLFNIEIQCLGRF